MIKIVIVYYSDNELVEETLYADKMIINESDYIQFITVHDGIHRLILKSTIESIEVYIDSGSPASPIF